MGPELVLVIGELAALGEDREVLDIGLREGAAHGIRIIASSARPEVLPYDLISGFTTRVLLHIDEEEQSIQLLGRPDAADLGADGDLLLRVGARSPALLRGFRVPPEHLDQLIDVMGEAYTRDPPDPDPGAEDSPEDSPDGHASPGRDWHPGICRSARWRKSPQLTEHLNFENVRPGTRRGWLGRPCAWPGGRPPGSDTPERRGQYRDITCRLAQLHCAEGEPSRAVDLYRDLLQDEPTLEDVVRQLFRCYQQLGDRNSLIRDERLLREALRQRYKDRSVDPDDREVDPALYEPEPETTEVYREVLAYLVESTGQSPFSIGRA